MKYFIFVYSDVIDMKDIWMFFAFPLNLLLGALMAVGLFWVRKSQSAIVRFLHSPSATISSIALLILACIWIGFSGDRNFAQSIVFVAALLYIQTVLFLITVRGLKTSYGRIRWRFLLLHAGLLLALGSGFWGSPDSSEYRIKLALSEPSREAYSMDGQKAMLPYEVSLADLKIEYSDEGKMIDYEAFISVNGDTPVSVSVNHPYGVSFGEDLYLASVSEGTCVLQVVIEPWRYFALAGIIMMLAGAFLLFINGPKKI